MNTKITRRTALQLISAAAGLVLFSGSVVADAKSEAYIQGIGNKVLQLANSPLRGKPLRAKFSALLGQHVNLRGITSASLGTYQKQLPAGDKDKLNELVNTYSAALFASSWVCDSTCCQLVRYKSEPRPRTCQEPRLAPGSRRTAMAA